jgi:hypothetical protein
MTVMYMCVQAYHYNNVSLLRKLAAFSSIQHMSKLVIFHAVSMLGLAFQLTLHKTCQLPESTGHFPNPLQAHAAIQVRPSTSFSLHCGLL